MSSTYDLTKRRRENGKLEERQRESLRLAHGRESEMNEWIMKGKEGAGPALTGTPSRLQRLNEKMWSI